ncbi:MAG: monovalent cation/proton antiporter, MnhG/PhaG subunit [Actinomycetia bacterium]|nr:monovalent cation/proton antiporter, MnhG/PhaG subunit [Actinomycetes bacterium]
MSGIIADVLVVLGLATMTLGVYGIVRFPDVYTQLHASGKAAFLGVSALLVAAAIGGGPEIVSRVVLTVVLLALTTPVAAHAIAQAAYHRREPMRSPGALDETATIPGSTPSPGEGHVGDAAGD